MFPSYLFLNAVQSQVPEINPTQTLDVGEGVSESRSVMSSSL